MRTQNPTPSFTIPPCVARIAKCVELRNGNRAPPCSKSVIFRGLEALDRHFRGNSRLALDWELDWGAIGTSAEGAILALPDSDDRICEPNPTAYQQNQNNHR